MSPAAARSQGNCIAIRTVSTTSSISRCSLPPSGNELVQKANAHPLMINSPVVWSSLDLVQKADAYPLMINSPVVSSSLDLVEKANADPLMINSQEERLRRLQHRMKVCFDASKQEHQEALRALWHATYPDQELHGLISDQWKEMGWQGRDPSTDFRGAGFISLENLLFFAKTFPASFQRLLKKQGGKRSAWEYPFAVAGVNITFMIMQMLDLDANNEWAFDLLYCVAFLVMDKQWLEKNATYMEFNDVLRSTQTQLEKELLMDDVLRIEDLPSYTLLW
nr:ELMO domain-containing protein A isoform X2 [Ipomoea batatas]